MRVGRRSTIALATVGALASTGTAYLGARNLLVGQATQARTIIPKSWDVPPRADGVYTPGGGPVQRWQRGMSVDLHLMIFGDSTATGYGCFSAEEVPGVLIARGLAERTGKRVRLSTKAIVGATSRGVSGQVDAMFVAGPPPDAAVMMLGANDVTALNGISQSARRLGFDRAQAAHPRCGGGRRYLPGPRRDRRHPPAAAVAGTLAGSATCPRPDRRGQGGGRCAGTVGDPAGAAIPGVARADVLRRRLSTPRRRHMRWRPSSYCPCSAKRWAKRIGVPTVSCGRRPARRRTCDTAVWHVAVSGPVAEPSSITGGQRLDLSGRIHGAPNRREPSCRKPSSSQLPAHRSAAP